LNTHPACGGVTRVTDQVETPEYPDTLLSHELEGVYGPDISKRSYSSKRCRPPRQFADSWFQGGARPFFIRRQANFDLLRIRAIAREGGMNLGDTEMPANHCLMIAKPW